MYWVSLPYKVGSEKSPSFEKRGSNVRGLAPSTRLAVLGYSKEEKSIKTDVLSLANHESPIASKVSGSASSITCQYEYTRFLSREYCPEPGIREKVCTSAPSTTTKSCQL